MDKNKIIQAATRYVQKGQYDKAIKEYQRIIEEDARDIRVLLKIGELHQKRGDNKESAATLLRVAEAYSNDGFFLKAAAVYKQVLKLNPALLDVNLRLAELYQQLGLMSDAMQQYQLVANAYEKLGNSGASLNLLKKLVDLEPDNAASRVRLAEAYSKEGMNPEAISELGKVAAQLKQSGRNEEFIKVAERLLTLDTQNLALIRELANIYLQRGETKRALARLQTCFKANPRDIETLILLAQTFLDLGQQVKTISVYKELARIYAERGRREEEQATWRRILTLAPSDPDALAATGQAAPVLEAEFEEVRASTEPSDTAPTVVRPPAAAATASAPAPAPASRPEGRSAEVQKLLTEADVYLKYGLREKAAAHLRRILAAAPESVAAHQKAKELHLLTGNTAGAADELVQCAQISLNEGNQPQAKVFLEQLRELSPNHPELARMQRLIGEVADLPELGEDEATLLEALPDEEELALTRGRGGAGLGGGRGRNPDQMPWRTSSRPRLVDEAVLVEGDEPFDPAEPEAMLEATIEGRGCSRSTSRLLRRRLGRGFERDGSGRAGSCGGFEYLGGCCAARRARRTSGGSGKRRARAGRAGGGRALRRRASGGRSAEASSLDSGPASAAASRGRPLHPYRIVAAGGGSGRAGRGGILPRSRTGRGSGGSAGWGWAIERLQPRLEACRERVEQARTRDWRSCGSSREEVSAEVSAAASPEPPPAVLAAAPIEPVGGFRPGRRARAGSLEERGGRTSHRRSSSTLSRTSSRSSSAASRGSCARRMSKPIMTRHVDRVSKEMGLMDEAISEFEVALRGAEGKPKEADCLSLLGACRAAKGDYAKALSAFGRAVNLKTLKPEGRLNLYFEIGSAREAFGDLTGALQAYEQVARVDPEYRNVGEAVSRLSRQDFNHPPLDPDQPLDESEPTLVGVRPGHVGKVAAK